MIRKQQSEGRRRTSPGQFRLKTRPTISEKSKVTDVDDGYTTPPSPSMELSTKRRKLEPTTTSEELKSAICFQAFLTASPLEMQSYDSANPEPRQFMLHQYATRAESSSMQIEPDAEAELSNEILRFTSELEKDFSSMLLQQRPASAYEGAERDSDSSDRSQSVPLMRLPTPI